MAGPIQVMAHRGASAVARENTVEAFRLAAQMGADAVELDVRRTRDAVLIVHHDARLADGSVIADLDANALPDHVPGLAEALDACAGMWVNVEIKNDPREADFDEYDGIADATMEVLIGRGKPERWLVSSFRMETIDRCRARADGVGAAIRTAWLTTEVPAGTAQRLVERGHAALHPWVALLTREIIDECHAAGLAVNTWTCDDPRRIAELIEWGVDGICTNRPDLAVRVLSERSGG